MLGVARRLFRKVFPRRKHPLLDADFSNDHLDRVYRDVVARVEPVVASDDFVMNRYYEGRRWQHVLREYTSGSRVLDVGAGNGAIELAFHSWTPFSIERDWNSTAVTIHEGAHLPLRRALSDAATLPFRNEAFDAVLCLETIEHVTDARAVGEEISRVLRPGGVLLITTPPRWRYAFAPDPHFGIRGLVILPHAMQRSVAASRGFNEAHHHVEKLFGSVSDIARLFPRCRVEDVLTRSRAPKRWFWDAIVMRKA